MAYDTAPAIARIKDELLLLSASLSSEEFDSEQLGSSIPPQPFSLRLRESGLILLRVEYFVEEGRRFEVEIHAPSMERGQHVLLNEELGRQSELLREEDADYPIFSLFSSLREFIESLPNLDPPPEESTPTISTVLQEDLRLKECVLWSHHLLATGKRKDIVNWASELQLYGISKPGYPGIIIVEGMEASVNEFVHRIKQLNWQALQVRHEDITTLELPADATLLPDRTTWIVKNLSKLSKVFPEGKIGVREVETMSTVGELCRSAGMEAGFLAALKISK